MRLLEYAQAVAAADTQLGAGVLDWDGHYRTMGALWRRFGTEHDPGKWGAVVQAATLIRLTT